MPQARASPIEVSFLREKHIGLAIGGGSSNIGAGSGDIKPGI